MQFRQIALTLIASLATSAAMAVTPVQSFVFDSGYNAAANPSLSWNNAFLAPNGLHFLDGADVTLANTVTGTDYSLELNFSFDYTSYAKKVIDFKALGADTGVYVDSGKMVFYSDAAGPFTSDWASTAVTVNPEQAVRLTLTRSGTGAVAGYLNGIQQFSFNDAVNATLFDSPNHVAIFFKDDNVTGGYERSPGVLHSLSLYDRALTAGEVNNIVAVPEPESIALIMAGLLTVVTLGRRRQAR